MKVFTPEISWHNRLPALSLDILQLGNEYRVATGGNDCRVYIWLIVPGTPEVKILAGLRRHQRSVGAVKFSSQGVLASGDDDGYIYIWKHAADVPDSNSAFLNDDGFEDLEHWQQSRVLRGHLEDICDLYWSKDGQFLLSGSVDNSSILWDALKGTKIWSSDLSKGYTQGVTIDPHSQYIATLSSDKTLRIYNYKTKRLMHAVRQIHLKTAAKAFICDDTIQTFCRRLEFSPDGQYLLTPTCRMVSEESSTNFVSVFKKSCFSKPTLYYPTGREVALCARFNPIVYKLRGETSFWELPYRFIFAIATSRSVIIYDSQQPTPIGYVSQIHLARLTDLAWSSDGKLLMVSSYDGYSTLVTFDDDEFGEIYTDALNQPEPEEVPPTTPPRRGQKRSITPRANEPPKKEKLEKETASILRYVVKTKIED